MTLYTFPPVHAHRTRTGKCPVCGKRATRSRTFTHTVNPLNLNPNGAMKTEAEVWLDVNEKADQWEPDFTHGKCREDR